MKVRARPMKAHERERYTLDRCSLQAKFLFVPKPKTNANEQSRMESDTEAGLEAQTVIDDVGTLSSLSLSASPPIPPTDDQVAEIGVLPACGGGLPRAAERGAAADRGGVETRRLGDEVRVEASAAGVTRKPGAVETEWAEETTEV